jgi:hypothetical protein
MEDLFENDLKGNNHKLFCLVKNIFKIPTWPHNILYLRRVH